MSPMEPNSLPPFSDGFCNIPSNFDSIPCWKDSSSAPDIVSGAEEGAGFSLVESSIRIPHIWINEEVGFQCSPTLRPAVPWPGSSSLFSSGKKLCRQKTKLTQPEEGLHSQKVSLNLSEIAAQLIENQQFCRVGKGLGVYLKSHWKLISDRETVQEVICDLLDDEIVQYINTQQLAEIASKIRLSKNIPRYDRVPEVNPHLLACQDGFFQWPGEAILPPSSRIIRFNHLNVSVNEIGPGSTPYFDMFLNNITGGNSSIAQRTMEVIGVILTGFPAKNFFLFQGESNTGKSQLATFLKNVLGESSAFAVNDVNDLGGTWTMGMLPGKLLCLCSDVPDTPLSTKAVGLIKQLTGGDLINGRVKYKSDIIFDNTAKLLFLSNFPLKISGGRKDAALVERLICIPFQNSVPAERRIPDIHKKLREEAGAIIWQALQALTDFEDRGGSFTPIESESQDEGDLLFIPNDHDLVRQFVDAACVLGPSESSTASELCSAYNNFRQQWLPTEDPIPISSFGKLLMGLGLPIERYATKSQRGYKGIRLCRPDEQTSFS